MNIHSCEHFFKNFSDRTRLAIITSLIEKPLSVNEIVEKTRNEQSNVSHQLKKLVHCKILLSERQGKRKIYSLNNKTISPILEAAFNHTKMNCQNTCNIQKND
tara:strand:+ start:985 stop:1293 length:309 start_codon:yes stop_codon:yes gene_type:complete